MVRYMEKLLFKCFATVVIGNNVISLEPCMVTSRGSKLIIRVSFGSLFYFLGEVDEDSFPTVKKLLDLVSFHV